MVMRPNIKGLSDEAMRALVMSEAWLGLEYLLSSSLAFLSG